VVPHKIPNIKNLAKKKPQTEIFSRFYNYTNNSLLIPDIAKDKISDDTPIELLVEAKAQWCLQRAQNATGSASDIVPPLPPDNWLIKDRLIDNSLNSDLYSHSEKSDGSDERWMSQVEIITHAGPHRRLWMGPQFMFKTYNTPSGSV
jgi:hypothetical protein